MAHPLVDQPLVDAAGGAGADERVPQRVEAPQNRPLAAPECPLEVVVDFAAGQRRRRLAVTDSDAGQPPFQAGGTVFFPLVPGSLAALAAAADQRGVAEQIRA